MRGTASRQTWDIRASVPPLEELAGVFAEGERLLWAATVPCDVFRKKNMVFGAIALILTALALATAPWGQSIAAYCGEDPSGSCRREYSFVWLLIATCLLLVCSVAFSLWQMRSAPWTYTYALSDVRACAVDSRKPKLWRTMDLTRYKARLRMLKTVSFGQGKDGLPAVAGLDPLEARQALCWATKGQLQLQGQAQKTP